MATILVVDDSAICREPIAEALRHHGHDAICATNGTQALMMVREHRPDLILLDLNMPGMDGMTALSTLRRNPDFMDIPVLLLTDRSAREDVLEASKRGVQGYLLKSRFSLDELFTRIDKCLETSTCASAPERLATTTATPNTSATVAILKAPPKSRPPSSRADSSKSVSAAATIIERPQDKKPSTETGKKLLAQICEGLELKPLGATVQNVLAASSSTSCSADDIARAAGPDQALCLQLLRVANSSAYRRGQPVNSVKSAVQRLGIQQVRNLVMTLDVLENYRGHAVSKIDARLFWEHSLACGLISGAIAKARQVKEADNYFLWGVLHDVGRLILLSQIPDRYAAVWDSGQKSAHPLEKAESQALQLDHCDVLAKALEHWKFPRDFIVPVTSHHLSKQKLERLAPAHRDAALTIVLANRLVHAMLLGDSGNETIYSLDEAVDLLGLRAAIIPQIVEAVPSETNDLKLAMLARTDAGSWPSAVAKIQDRLSKPVHALCVSGCPEMDVFRMFFERLAPPSSDGPPNLGVLYLREDAEQAEVTAKFEAAERNAGGEGLPILVISDKGKVNCEDPWLRKRKHHVLGMPASIPSVVDAVKKLVTPEE